MYLINNLLWPLKRMSRIINVCTQIGCCVTSGTFACVGEISIRCFFSENVRNPYIHAYIHTHARRRSLARTHTHTHTHTHYVDKVRLSGVFLTERKSKLIAFTLSPRDNMLTAEPACYGIWCWRAYFRFPQVQFWLKSNLNNSVHSPNAFPRVRRI